MKKAFFIDFDGTITKTDTCAAMVQTFAKDGWQQINRLWESKHLSTQECAEQTFRLFQIGLEELKSFLEEMCIDEYFKAFINCCQQKNYPVYILSDGYDVNINTVLLKHAVDLPFYANRLVYTDRFHIESPYINDECGRCGTCKSRLMEQLNPHGSMKIYIGDGYSDTCPAAKADLVFAKGSLLNYCRKHDIAAIPFKTFQDILKQFCNENREYSQF